MQHLYCGGKDGYQRKCAKAVSRALYGRAAGLAAAFFLSGCLTGCGTNEAADRAAETISAEASGLTDGVSKTEEAEQTTGVNRLEEEAEPFLPPTAYVTKQEMELADQWQSCDDAALASVMRKAEAGEPVTIACIGGSITQGTISNGSKDKEVADKKPYADLFAAWWQKRFPKSQITLVNAGIGGTDSYLGVHRLKEDVLDFHPDLVLVEFSVNDADSPFYKKSYDNLVRNILQSEDRPAVMLLFMAQTNGASAQGSHVLIGYNYKLPMLSYANAIKSMMESGHYSEKELSGDGVHPSALGHAITGEILWNYLNMVYQERESFGEPQPFDAEAVTTAVYEEARLLDGGDIVPEDLGTFTEGTACAQYPDGWSSEEGDGGIVFKAAFRRLGILYLSTTDGKSGQYDIYVDGEAVRMIDADFSGGWGNAITATEVYSSEEEAEHVVEIRKNPASTGDEFVLLGLLTS